MEQNKIIDTLRLSECNGNIRIARYFSRSKLRKLLKSEELWFSNSDKFPDKKEREIPSGFFKNWNEESIRGFSEITSSKNKIIKAYISCWTKFNAENYAMWKIYDKYSNGACLITTAQKLRDAVFKKCPCAILQEVNYIDLEDKTKRYDLPWVIFDNNSFPFSQRVTEIYKQKAYHYEEEIRSIIYQTQKQYGDGFGLKIDLNNLIDEIIISPFSSPETYQKTKSLLLKKFDEKIIYYSKIDEK